MPVKTMSSKTVAVTGAAIKRAIETRDGRMNGILADGGDELIVATGEFRNFAQKQSFIPGCGRQYTPMRISSKLTGARAFRISVRSAAS